MELLIDPLTVMTPVERRRAAFVQRHQHELWRYLVFLGCDRETAEDLLQDALVVALERDVWRLADAAAARWLRTTARNLYLMELRATARRPVRVEIDLERLDAAWTERHARRHTDLELLERALQQLPLKERRAIELRYRYGSSRGEMAELLTMSSFGVKSLLRRARQRLRTVIEGMTGEGLE